METTIQKIAGVETDLKERIRVLEGVQKAMMNLLEDFNFEKDRLENSQKATLNILEDYDMEKIRLEGVQRAVFNILEDFSEEKVRLVETQRASVNILEDFETEKAKLDVVNKELEREIGERRRAEKELEFFNYSVSHDLRGPLRAIDGFSKILVEDYRGKVDEEGMRILNVIMESAKKMGRLIDELLALSRVGQKGVVKNKIDMRSLVDRVVHEVQRTLACPSVRVVIQNLPDAYGDAILIEQVLTNLVSNAFKFTRKHDKPAIEIGFQDGKGEVVYAVKDNGIGFDMKYHNKLFGVFERLHREEEFEGTGVGLAIVQRIVQKHGGRVWAEGKVGQGATFYFTLPS